MERKIQTFYIARPLIILSFNAARENGKPFINRIEIQKIIFCTLYSQSVKDVILEKLDFDFYKKGPYTQIIQRGIESLIISKHIKIEVTKRMKKKTYEKYKLSDTGLKLATKLIQSHEHELYFQSCLGFCAGMKLIGWKNLINITYEIPEIKNKKFQFINLSHLILTENTLISQIWMKIAKEYEFKNRDYFTLEKNIAFVTSLALVEVLKARLSNKEVR